MTALRAIGMAFSLYSRIPMPRLNWESRSRALVLYAFPLVGLAVGGLEVLALWLSRLLGLNGLLTGAILTAVPIHLDGFCDVWDARSSHQSRGRKLEILKDSHVGAFAVIHCALLLLLTCGLWSQLAGEGAELRPALALLPVFSRCLSAFGALSLPNARGEGMLASVTEGERSPARWLLLLGSGLCAAALGGVGIPNLFAPAAGYLTFVHYVRTAKREFGGTTGDLSGWFLQRCEFCTLAGLVLARSWEAL